MENSWLHKSFHTLVSCLNLILNTLICCTGVPASRLDKLGQARTCFNLQLDSFSLKTEHLKFNPSSNHQKPFKREKVYLVQLEGCNGLSTERVRMKTQWTQENCPKGGVSSIRFENWQLQRGRFDTMCKNGYPPFSRPPTWDLPHMEVVSAAKYIRSWSVLDRLWKVPSSQNT